MFEGNSQHLIQNKNGAINYGGRESELKVIILFSRLFLDTLM